MERALLIEAKTYGFFHAGMAPLRREVLKRSWAFIPGSTLFGALRAGMIRLEGPVGGGPATLIDHISNGRLRFTPLLPDRLGSVHTGSAYCRLAVRLTNSVGQADGSHYQTTPHVPLNRRRLHGEDSLVFAVESHLPEQRYRGWVFCDSTAEPLVRQAMNIMPFLPFGGRGKYTPAEFHIVHAMPLPEFVEELQQAIPRDPTQIEMITPLVIEGYHETLISQASSLHLRPPRRYVVWRTGLYPDATQDALLQNYGHALTEADADLPPLAWERTSGYVVGQESQAVLALPENSRFVIDMAEPERPEEIAWTFVRGAGRPDWASLGWGQIAIHLPDTEQTLTRQE